MTPALSIRPAAATLKREMAWALRRPNLMKVERAPARQLREGEMREQLAGTQRGLVGTVTSSVMETIRSPSLPTTCAWASNATRGGRLSAQAAALITFPPRVPVLRIWGLPTVRHASTSMGAAARSSGCCSRASKCNRSANADLIRGFLDLAATPGPL